jgi:hypothetical protein
MVVTYLRSFREATGNGTATEQKEASMNTSIRRYGGRTLPRWRTIGAALAALGIVAGAVVTAHYQRGHSTPSVLAAAATVQGGCKPYQVQAASLGTFAMGVCVTDNGTGSNAYPFVDVMQVPPYLGTSCTIGIELWDNHAHNYGTLGRADCKPGSYPGKPFGPVTQQTTLHAFARLTICVLDACTPFYLGNGAGDSPSIELQPFVVTSPVPSAAASTKTRPKPLPPVLPAPPGQSQKRRDGPDCGLTDADAQQYLQRIATIPPTTGIGFRYGAKYDPNNPNSNIILYSGGDLWNPSDPNDSRRASPDERATKTNLARKVAEILGSTYQGDTNHAEQKMAVYMRLKADGSIADTKISDDNMCQVINNPQGPCLTCIGTVPRLLSSQRPQTLTVIWRAKDGRWYHLPL